MNKSLLKTFTICGAILLSPLCFYGNESDSTPETENPDDRDASQPEEPNGPEEPEEPARGLIINEIMQSNIDCLMDDLNNFPDSWVELLNVGDVDVDLSEYSLGDSSKPKKAFPLPAITVKGGERIVIYCDKEGTGLHTDFRLESGKGCEVYLFHGEEVVDFLSDLKKQPAPNVAYGRIADGTDEWGYMAVPTPNEPNCNQAVSTLLSDPVFSAPGLVSSDPFTLSITLPDDAPEGAAIHYTLDGTEPTELSPVWEEDLYVDRTTVVRAKVILEGFISPRSLTHSYIFDDYDTPESMGFVSIVTDSDYFYSPSLGIYVTGDDSSNPNFSQDWRRPVNVEFFASKGEPSSINQLSETKVKGGASRTRPLKSLVLYANKRFGEKRFNYEFFESAPGIDEFKSIELRNSGNDFNNAMMRDAIIQESAGNQMGLDWQPHKNVRVYLNGEYLGFLRIRPRSNEDHIAAFYDGLEDIDMIENWTNVETGTKDSFRVFRTFYQQEGHTLDEYRELMDVEECANFFILNIFYDNKDFPSGNIVQWRPTADDGKWRWLVKDTDHGLGYSGAEWGYEYPTLKWITNKFEDPKYSWGNTSGGTHMLRNLMENDDFRTMFAERAAVFMGDFLRPEKVIALIDREKADIDPDMKIMEAMYPRWIDFDSEVEGMREWMKGRVPFFYSDLAEFFELGAPVPLEIDADGFDLKSLTINGIDLAEPYFDGQWFTGSNLVVQSKDCVVKSYMLEVDNDEEGIATSYGTLPVNIEVPSCKSLKIHFLTTDLTGIDGITVPDLGVGMDTGLQVYSTQGMYLGTFGSHREISAKLPPGVYIIRTPAKAYKFKTR